MSISSENIDRHRRCFIGAAALSAGAASLGVLFPSKAMAGAPSFASGGGNAPIGSLKNIDAGVLNIAYAEAGPTTGTPVILLHGWPYDIHSFAEVIPILANRGFRVIVPHLRGFGPTRFLAADTVRSGEPAATASDLIALMDAMHIRSAILGGFDWGARTAAAVAALRPEQVKGLVAVSGYIIGNQAGGREPLPPAAEFQWWYQFYFATERGRAGYAKNTAEFNKQIWKQASPRWNFDDATFARSAAAFDNPDHVAVVIHNYRWRMGLADGDPHYSDVASRLDKLPGIGVPTITMEGDANGAPHLDPAAYRAKFTGKYEHRTITGGVGHNLPQESPLTFAQAAMDVARL